MSIRLDWWPAFGADAQITITSKESMVAFKEMMRRALNTWPEASPELKDLADILEFSKPLQDYWSTRTDIKSSRPEPESVRVLSQEEVDKRYVHIK